VLVALKPTYVRAYPRQDSGPAATSVEAWLHGERNGSPLPGSPLRPVNGTQSTSTGRTYDRAEADQSWIFSLPRSWREGTIELTVEVDPREIYDDPGRGDNEWSDSFTFDPEPPECIVFVPVRTADGTYKKPKDNPNFKAMLDRARRLWHLDLPP
jgi:hypothetical protein